MALKTGERIGIGFLFLFIIALAAFMVIFIIESERQERRERCRIQLGQIYLSLTFSPKGWKDPDWKKVPPGPDFWIACDEWPGPPPGFREEWLCCPVRNVPGQIDYRGPLRAIDELTDDDPIAADRPGNHGPEEGGSVLLKNGTIRQVPRGDPLWKRANETTK